MSPPALHSIAIVGAGRLGGSLAALLSQRGLESTVVGRGEAIPSASVVVLAVPGEFLGTTLSEIDLDGKVAISLVKSARQTKGDVATVCEDVEAKFKTCRACALSGPNIYGSLARGEFAEATVVVTGGG